MKTLNEADRSEIVLYRIQKAETAYQEATATINLGFVGTAANRLYYAVYYAVSALLIANGITVRTHLGVKRMFGLHFIKPKLLDKRFGITFNRLLSLRMTGDYEDRRNLDMISDVCPLVEPTRELIDTVSKMAKEKI